LGESFLAGLDELGPREDGYGFLQGYVVVGCEQSRGRAAVASDLVGLVSGLRIGDQLGQPSPGVGKQQRRHSRTPAHCCRPCIFRSSTPYGRVRTAVFEEDYRLRYSL